MNIIKKDNWNVKGDLGNDSDIMVLGDLHVTGEIRVDGDLLVKGSIMCGGMVVVDGQIMAGGNIIAHQVISHKGIEAQAIWASMDVAVQHPCVRQELIPAGFGIRAKEIKTNGKIWASGKIDCPVIRQ